MAAHELTTPGEVESLFCRNRIPRQEILTFPDSIWASRDAQESIFLIIQRLLETLEAKKPFKVFPLNYSIDSSSREWGAFFYSSLSRGNIGRQKFGKQSIPLRES